MGGEAGRISRVINYSDVCTFIEIVVKGLLRSLSLGPSLAQVPVSRSYPDTASVGVWVRTLNGPASGDDLRTLGFWAICGAASQEGDGRVV